MTALRGTAFAVGLALLVATAHATISATGGYGTAHSYVTLAIAAGVCISALAIGSAWSERPFLAGWLVVAILAGEAFGFLSTAERLVAGREADQVPLRAAADAHAKASRRVAEAIAASERPSTSPRLTAALAAKAAADQAATDKSTERGCRDNCRQLLQARADAAEREVVAARDAIATTQAASRAELDASRAALAALKAPASATPLADRVGVAAWALDLLSAALGSVAANGLACGLISFAGHRSRKRDTLAASPARLPRRRRRASSWPSPPPIGSSVLRSIVCSPRRTTPAPTCSRSRPSSGAGASREALPRRTERLWARQWPTFSSASALLCSSATDG